MISSSSTEWSNVCLRKLLYSFVAPREMISEDKSYKLTPQLMTEMLRPIFHAAGLLNQKQTNFYQEVQRLWKNHLHIRPS